MRINARMVSLGSSRFERVTRNQAILHHGAGSCSLYVRMNRALAAEQCLAAGTPYTEPGTCQYGLCIDGRCSKGNPLYEHIGLFTKCELKGADFDPTGKLR